MVTKMKVGPLTIGPYTIAGGLFDLLDVFVIGLIPGIGDIIDVLAAFLWYRVLESPVGFLAGIEVVPSFDLLPTNIVLGLMADQKTGRKRQ